MAVRKKKLSTKSKLVFGGFGDYDGEFFLYCEVSFGMSGNCSGGFFCSEWLE